MENKINLPQMEDENKEQPQVQVNENQNIQDNIAVNETSDLGETVTVTPKRKVLFKKFAEEEGKEKKFLSFKTVDKNKPTDDALATRKFAWLAYILFFIPLLINRNSEFVKHNVNEGLEIFCIDVIGALLWIIGSCVKTTSIVAHGFMIAFTIIGIFLIVLTTITKIYMITVTAMGRKVTTPWFFHLKMVK